MSETDNDVYGNGAGDLERLCDRDLIHRFADRRDEEAFRLLVERHGTLVFGVCRRILRRHQDAEDAFQATFLVLAQKAGSVRWRESLANWLYGTACRIAWKAGTRLQRRQEQKMDDEPAVSSGFDAMAAHEAGYTLHEELGRLPEQYRAPLVLCYLEGKSRDEAAEELGVSTDAVKGRLERGRHQLRVRLLRRGIGITLPAVTSGAALSAGAAEAASSLSSASSVVPDSLLTSTVEAATTFATGGSCGGAASTQALTLAKGELAMLSSATIVKQAVTAAVAVAVLGVSYLLFSGNAVAEKPGRPTPVDTRYLTNAAAGGELRATRLALGTNDRTPNAQKQHNSEDDKQPPTTKRQRFVPKKGMADETSWTVLDNPSALNPDGWAVMARMTLGGDAPVKLHSEDEQRFRMQLVKGDDDTITLRLSHEKQTQSVTLQRDVSRNVKLHGRIYRLRYSSVEVSADRPDTTPFAHVTVTPAEPEGPSGSESGERSKESNSGAKDATEGDYEKIQGTWNVVSVKDGGRQQPENETSNLKWVITKEKIIHKVSRKKTTEWTYELDSTKNPKWIDITDPNRDRTTPGIYELKGDTLKICFPESGNGERSTAFESKPNSVNDVLLILKRE